MTDPGQLGKATRTSNGESSIYQDATGRWHGWVSMGVKPNGAPDRRHRTATTRKAVVAKVKELERQRESGAQSPVGSATTVEDYLQHWIRNVAPGYLRRKSLAANASDTTHLIRGLGKHRLARLTTAQIEAFYASMARETKEKDGQTVPRYRPATIDHVHRTLRSALRDAERAGLIATNVAKRVQRRRDQSIEAADTTIEPFDVPAARAIIRAAAGRRGGTRYVLALVSGLRQGECLGLPWAALHLDEPDPWMTVSQQLQRHTWLHGCAELPDGRAGCLQKRGADCPKRHSGGLVLTQVKTKRGERRLALDPITADLLREHRLQQHQDRMTAGSRWVETGLVFTQVDGSAIDPRADLRDWKLLLREAGVREARLHDARHTAATLLLVQGVNARVVMEILGWSSMHMVQRYQHVLDELRRDAAIKIADVLHGEPLGNSL